MRQVPPIVVVCLLAAGCAQPVARSSADHRLRQKGAEFFLGEWDFDYRAADGTPERLHWSLARWFNGSWYVGEAQLGDALAARDAWSVTADGSIVRVYFDSNGNHGVLRSTGWDGDRLTFAGVLHTPGGPVDIRERIERLDPGSFRATWETRVGDGWRPLSYEKGTRR